MKRAAIFFDRDNTLIASDGYLGNPAEVKLIPGAAAAVARARAMGYAAVVVSNQSGVARGMFDEAAVRAVNARVDELLRKENPAAIIDRHEYCPFHPEAVVDGYRQDSDLRKPKPGMIYAAAEALQLDVKRSWVVGDAPRDVEAGKAAGCRTVLFQDPSLPKSPAAEASPGAAPDHVAETLQDALNFIEKHTTRPTAKPPASITPAAAPLAAKATAPAITVAGKPVVPPAAAAPAQPRAAQTARPPEAAPPPNARLEALAEQILLELRRRNEQQATEFSVSKLLAGIVQVIVLAVLFLGYLKSRDTVQLHTYLFVALTLQTLTIALLIMSRQR